MYICIYRVNPSAQGTFESDPFVVYLHTMPRHGHLYPRGVWANLPPGKPSD